MEIIDFEDGKAVKEEILRKMSGRFLHVHSEIEDGRQVYTLAWGTAGDSLSAECRSNGWSFFLDLAFIYSNGHSRIKFSKFLTIPAAAPVPSGLDVPQFVKALTKSIENYEP